MSKILIILSFFSILCGDLSAQIRKIEFKEIETLQLKTPKPLVVLIMTSWCKYCHAMKNIMNKDPNVLALLNDKFYTTFLDAEYKGEIFFAGRSFKNRTGLHELARELGTINGKISYPTIAILNTKNEIVYQYDGFLPPRTILTILKKIEQD